VIDYHALPTQTESMKPHCVEFYASSPNGLRAQATAAVSDAMRRGSTILVVGLDSLSRLDDAEISATIVALRGLRETGGTVRLVTQSVAHRHLLKAMGLDRIFGVFASFEEAAERAEQRDCSFLLQ
jgi:anti-anti-sigma regulatory factor